VRALQWSHLGCRAVNRCAHDVKTRIHTLDKTDSSRCHLSLAGGTAPVSSRVTGWAWEQELPVQRKCVLLWLAERATDNGVCFPGQTEIRQKTGLSESMVRRYLHWLAADHDDDGRPKPSLVRIIQRPVVGGRNTSNVYVLLVPWARHVDVRRELEELKYVPPPALEGVGGTGAPQGGAHGCTPVGGVDAPQLGGTGAREEPSRKNRHLESLPHAPEDDQPQHGSFRTDDGAPDCASSRTPAGLSDSAQGLADAFYRGLGAAAEAVTTAIRRRDAAIAAQLVAAGATAAEAEAYARESSTASGRIVSVDLRSFERERLGWLARRRSAGVGQRRLVDRTGQPPSWETQNEHDAASGIAQSATNQPASIGPSSAKHTSPPGEDLAAKLREILLRGDQQS
jgi:hypothetical protein